jgi:hypothetical protein
MLVAIPLFDLMFRKQRSASGNDFGWFDFGDCDGSDGGRGD